MKNATKIEFSPELEPTLRVLAAKVEADTAILYRLVPIKDVVPAELLHLISSSDMAQQNPDFYRKIINLPNADESSKLEILINQYQMGTIDYEKESELITFLKKNIRILRFTEYAEKDISKKIYDFDYTKRPQKYLILNDDILTDDYKKKEGYRNKECYNTIHKYQRILLPYRMFDKFMKPFWLGPFKIPFHTACTKQIPGEGVTAFVIRSEGSDAQFTNKNGKLERVKLVNCFVSKESLDSCEAHITRKPNHSAYKISGNHNVGFVLLKEQTENGQEETIGCLRFEIGKDIPDEKITEITKSLKLISNENFIHYFNKLTDEVFKSYEDTSYETLFRCLIPLLDQMVEIEKILKYKINKLEMLISQHNSSNKSNKETTELNPDATDKKPNQKLVQEIEDLKKKLLNNKSSEIYNTIAEIEKMLAINRNLLEIHTLIQHLFIVFKRNTYYSDSIYQRIDHFINDLLGMLNLPKEVFSSIWSSLRKQEELLLYDIKNYRDHYLHQFHVFVIGYIFIYSYGIDRFRNLTIQNYLPKKEEKDNSYEEKNFNCIEVLRIWALTSLFHDCGYSFEKFNIGFDNFTQNTLLSIPGFKINWDDYFLKESYIAQRLASLTQYYSRCNKFELHEKNADLYRILVQKAILNADHGVFSAVILQQHLANVKKGTSDAIKDGFPLHVISDIACLAIALHNDVYHDIVDQIGFKICFNANPYLFLLIYCDTVQEWGRKRSHNYIEHDVYPRLESIDYLSSLKQAATKSDEIKKPLNSVDNPKNQTEKDVFSLKLSYIAYGNENRPTKPDILSFVNRAAMSLIVPCDKNIRISYQIGFDELFDVYFSRCIDDCRNCEGKVKSKSDEV